MAISYGYSNKKEQKMFDVYVYNELGEFVDMIPNIAQDRYKALAMKLVAEDFSIKVVDQFDGAVVYTLDALPQ